MASKRPRIDHLTRYWVAALLFLGMYATLTTRALFEWPDVDKTTLRILWLALTTPALVLVLWNLTSTSVRIRRRRRKIDRMLDEKAEETV